MDDSLGSPLGKLVSYCEEYDPGLLYPIARSGKRAELGITDRLPFVGVDIWNAYELSWLNLRGKPVVALAEFRVPAESPRLIESKSLKLYLNSFNQTRLDGPEEAQRRIARDLSDAAGADVEAILRPVTASALRSPGVPSGHCIDNIDIEITHYTPDSQLLRCDPSRRVGNEILYSHLLKSNCLVTGQPDWGMLAIRYSGTAIDRASLLRYIVSFRQHNEFHEQCVERVFADIQERCQPHRLAVWARYTRRGGLDINPVRASDQEWLDAVGNIAEVRQ